MTLSWCLPKSKRRSKGRSESEDGAIGALDPGAIDSIYVSPLLMFGTVAIRKAR